MDIRSTYTPVFQGRFFFVSLLLTLTSSPSVARQQAALEVRLGSESTLHAKPGSILTASVKVSNFSGARQTYQARATFPRGWRAVSRESPFDLSPGESDIRLVSVAVPADAPASTYEIAYRVRDAALSPHEAAVSITVVVAEVVQLDLQLLDAPRFVIAGRTLEVTFLVTNKGNSGGPVRLKSRSSHDLPIRLDSTVLYLVPRESREVFVRVLTQPTSEKLEHTLQLEAISGIDSSVTVRASSVVPVISGETKAAAQFLEYPMYAKIREVGQDGVFITQAEISGYGSLDEQRTDRLEFLIRTPETQTVSALGLRDEYRVAYRAQGVELFAGDMNYSLSTLTEVGRFATGVGGRKTVGSFEFGGFYNTMRWMNPAQREGGGFVGYEAAQHVNLSVNYLAKREQFTSDMLTLRGVVASLFGSNLDAEYANGTKNGKTDAAYALKLDGNQQWVSYDLRYVQAGSDFGGYYRDINFTSASVNFRPGRNIYIQSYVRQEDRNLSHDTSQVYAPRGNFYQIGAGYADYASLYLRRDVQKDQFDSSKYYRIEDAVQARFGYNFGQAGFFTNIDFGNSRDQNTGRTTPYQRFAVNASYRPTGGQNFSTSFEYYTDHNLYTSEVQERISGSLTAWMLFGQSTQFQLNLYATRVNASSPQTFALLEGSLEHLFPFNHRIILRGRQNVVTPSETNQQTSYLLEYAIPIAVPLRRLRTVGQLRGRIVEANNNPVSGALINAGTDAAVSDNSGEFVFAALRPGPTFVLVDRASIGLDRITVQPMPMDVLIRGGEESAIMLTVTKSAQIDGTVAFFEAEEQAMGNTSLSYAERGGRPGVFLELSNGSEVHRRVTDNRGRFTFGDMRPGSWQLIVTGGDIPDRYDVQPRRVELEIGPGERKSVAIDLKPRRRAIKMLEQGKLIQLQPAKEEPRPLKLEPKPRKRPTCLVKYDRHRSAYVLQVSSWRTRSKAETVAASFRKSVVKKVFVMTRTVPSFGIRSGVFIGDFKSRKEAELYCKTHQFK